MSILVIGPDEQREIDKAIERARAKPTPWEARALFIDESSSIAQLEDVRRMYPTQQLMLGTYQVAFSFEYQPAGLFRHLSVSSRAAGKVPGPEVMQMVCEVFKFSDALCRAIGEPEHKQQVVAARVWAEEYEPDRMAINVIELAEAAETTP